MSFNVLKKTELFSQDPNVSFAPFLQALQNISPLNRSIINDLKDCNIEGEDDIFFQLNEMFQNNFPEKIENIKLYYRKQEMKKLCAEAHQLKFASSGMGAQSIAKVCQYLEYTETWDDEVLLTLIECLEHEFERTLLALQNEIKSPS
ncbi:MAG: Hpt domain-containing protein [Bacteriovoracaceae bacterium]|nr:Hpt domain-containing protein [Bacteriovoracaceae bacterium]